MRGFGPAARGLLVLGLARMACDVLGWRTLGAVAAATALSPAPKVFSAVQGLETYSTRFHLEWTDVAGERHELELSSERYAGLRGPYNRRNVYGAALAYGPVLASDQRTRPMLGEVLRHALTGDAPLLRELGLDPATVVLPLTLRYETVAGTPPELPTKLEVPFE